MKKLVQVNTMLETKGKKKKKKPNKNPKELRLSKIDNELETGAWRPRGQKEDSPSTTE